MFVAKEFILNALQSNKTATQMGEHHLQFPGWNLPKQLIRTADLMVIRRSLWMLGLRCLGVILVVIVLAKMPKVMIPIPKVDFKRIPMRRLLKNRNLWKAPSLKCFLCGAQIMVWTVYYQ